MGLYSKTSTEGLTVAVVQALLRNILKMITFFSEYVNHSLKFRAAMKMSVIVLFL